MGRDSTGELVQEIPQEFKTTELQVPPLAQVPTTADWPALSLGFRSAGDIGQASQDLLTLQLAVQVNRRVGGGLLSQRTPLKRPQAIYLTTLRGLLL